MIIGMGVWLMQLKTRYQFRLSEYINKSAWMHLVFAGGYTLFVVKYVRDYPDFSTMKSVFLFPALPSFVYAFSEGFSMIKQKYLSITVTMLIVFLLVMHLADEFFLIAQLM